MENLNQLTISDLKSLVKSWVVEALFDVQQTGLTTNEKGNKFLTVSEAAAFLNLVPVTIYKKVSDGELKAFKRGKRLYFERDTLLKYIQDQQKPINKRERG